MAARGGVGLDARWLRLHVGVQQTAARRLFETAGFEPALEGHGRYGRGEQALCLQRSLAAVGLSEGPERHLQIQECRRPDAGQTNSDTGAA
jgi:ribosomal protein S18 acetylase RimI-like enzyme